MRLGWNGSRARAGVGLGLGHTCWLSCLGMQSGQGAQSVCQGTIEEVSVCTCMCCVCMYVCAYVCVCAYSHV